MVYTRKQQALLEESQVRSDCDGNQVAVRNLVRAEDAGRALL